jgi:hypothetical protein
MQISKLYDKEIDRRINPAVVVSEMKDYFVNQEIKEYVFTNAVAKNMYKFLDAIANKTEGKTGVWISGYYGSGKSHFIKFLFYCLNNKYRTDAFDNFKDFVKEMDPLDEPSINQVLQIQKSLDKMEIDEIIFNIDAVSKNDETIDRITRVLLRQLNLFRGLNGSNISLALYLEKPLQQAGKFEDFKKKIETTFKEKWEGKQIPRFINRYLDNIIEIATQFDDKIDKETLKASILNSEEDYSIEFLIEELKEFTAEKPENYRLVFLIDEISQYIGSNTSLLLNLQTIVEEIGTHIGQKVWIVCTAQQDLSNLIDNTDNQTEDFGKILGRFETMISLESQDAAFITKKRLLEKDSDGLEILTKFYKSNHGAINNQFVFDHDLYENYNDKEDFLLTYPFIPYQFRLISDVFQSFSNSGYVGEGVKNTERSILGITHYTAQQCKEKEIGYFVPFDLFFNDQLKKNLTHHALSILDRAYNIKEVREDGFAVRVVNALFMVSSLMDSQSVNFSPNIENISLLLVDDLSISKQQIQQKVQGVLDVLTSKNIIQVSEGKYRFLREDEIEVASIISKYPITTDKRLDYIFEDIITQITKPISQMGTVQHLNNSFRVHIKIDDKEKNIRGDFALKFSLFDSTEMEVLAHRVPSTELVIGLHQWFKDDKDLKKQIQDYTRTQNYIADNYTNATGTRQKTIDTFVETNKRLLEEIKQRFRNKFLMTDIISSNIVIKAADLNGSTPAARLDDMFKKHLEQVYKKHHLSTGKATSNQALVNNAASTQLSTKRDLDPAEEEVNNKLNFEGDGVVVADVIKMFEKPPYGWKDLATIDILLNLARLGHRRFEWRNEEVNLKTFADKALNSREREALTIHKEKVHSTDEVKNFVNTVNDIFNENIIPSNTTDFKTAIETFREKLKPLLTKLHSLKEEIEPYPFVSHVKVYHDNLSALFTNRNNEEILTKVLENKEALQNYRDTFMLVEEFKEYNFDTYVKMFEFVNENKNNFESLDDTEIEKANTLKAYLQTHQSPWEDFPQMKKAHKEIHTALKDRLDKLRKKVRDMYEGIIQEIQLKQAELEINEPNLTTDRDYILGKIHREKQISQLEILELKADAFKAENFKILDDYKAKEKAKAAGKDYKESLTIHLAAEMPPTTIETPEQLDAYIEKLRKSLMIKLSKNQKLFLN